MQRCRACVFSDINLATTRFSLIGQANSMAQYIVNYKKHQTTDKTIKGEPSSHHIFLYALADFFGRVFKMIPLTKMVRNNFGTSMTRSSIKNSPKYFLTSRRGA